MAFKKNGIVKSLGVVQEPNKVAEVEVKPEVKTEKPVESKEQK